jgi:hypothetical protein
MEHRSGPRPHFGAHVGGARINGGEGAGEFPNHRRWSWADEIGDGRVWPCGTRDLDSVVDGAEQVREPASILLSRSPYACTPAPPALSRLPVLRRRRRCVGARSGKKILSYRRRCVGARSGNFFPKLCKGRSWASIRPGARPPPAVGAAPRHAPSACLLCFRAVWEKKRPRTGTMAPAVLCDLVGG